jgi:predicted ABC-type ATPase
MAGPNGSGKSTIVKKIRSRYYCGYFVNADEIQSALETKKVLNLNAEFGLNLTRESFDYYLRHQGQSWLDKATIENSPVYLTFSDNNLVVPGGSLPGQYDAAIAADFIRFQLLGQGDTFTFETVLSHPSKLGFMQSAKDLGFKNYLYFACTVDPAINLDRIARRVELKGHYVPDEKVVKRYYESLALLQSLIPLTHRTFLFDNSEENAEIKIVAEIEGGKTFIPHTDYIPWWVNEYVIDTLFPDGSLS